MRYSKISAKLIAASIGLATLLVTLIGCNTQKRNTKPREAAPVNANFVLTKVRYGFSKEAEREIWCFDSDEFHWTSYPSLYATINRYRTIAWAREAVGGDRIFQTYDLVSDHMNHVLVAATPKNGINHSPWDVGWRTAGSNSELHIPANSNGMKYGDLEVHLDGTWKKVSELYSRDLTSADGPSLIPGKYTFDAFFGDVVIIMSGQEILRQRVEGLTEQDLDSKCQAFPLHELFVYLDGIPDRPGTAWFLDLALGKPRPIQSPGGIFPGRNNTLPRIKDLNIWHSNGTNPLGSTEKLEIEKSYLLKLSVVDPDLDCGDEIIDYEWQLENNKIISTKTPELAFVFHRKGEFHFRARAIDKSKMAGPWYRSYDNSTVDYMGNASSLSSAKYKKYYAYSNATCVSFRKLALNRSLLKNWIKYQLSADELNYTNLSFKNQCIYRKSWDHFFNSIHPEDKIFYWENMDYDVEPEPFKANGFCIIRNDILISTFFISPVLH